MKPVIIVTEHNMSVEHESFSVIVEFKRQAPGVDNKLLFDNLNIAPDANNIASDATKTAPEAIIPETFSTDSPDVSAIPVTTRGHAEEHTGFVCPVCGGVVKKPRKNQKYCSKSCGSKHLHQLKGHQLETHEPKPAVKICPRCGSQFTTAKNSQKYCDNCRMPVNAPESIKQVQKQRPVPSVSSGGLHERERKDNREKAEAIVEKMKAHQKNMVPVRIDDRTTIMVAEGADKEEARNRFLAKRKAAEEAERKADREAERKAIDNL